MYYKAPDNSVHFLEDDSFSHLLPPGSLSIAEEEAVALLPKPDASAIVAAKIEALWNAANSYESGYISGVGLSILTVGVLQSKPKALAVKAWSKSLWTEYYARKAAITATSVDNHDFSSFGPMPHSVPELQAEVGL